MKEKDAIQSAEAEWNRRIRQPAFDAEGSVLLSVCGPSGAGKTTVVKSLSDCYAAYLEITEDNPHLNKFLEGGPDFNAAANQEWFLYQIEQFLSSASNKLPTVLDQDPAGIVFGYSRIFHEDGLINDVQYQSLLGALLRLEDALLRWKTPRIVLCLSAPAKVLYERVVQRSGASCTPPLAWFERLADSFHNLFSLFPRAIILPTADQSVAQLVSHVRLVLENRC